MGIESDEIKRLFYYNRQYLGFKDLRDEQYYHTWMRRRHNLAHHAWGIVLGLKLELQESVPGSKKSDKAVLLPGFAVDGYGREIVVPVRHTIEKKCFLEYGAPPPDTDLFIKVWLAYDEIHSAPPEDGYGVCGLEDQYTRVKETYKVYVGEPEEIYAEIKIAGKTVGTANVPPDKSIPYQELPPDITGWPWLVCLGAFKWDGNNFVAKPEGDKQKGVVYEKKILEGRQYVGSVADKILAPAGELRVKDRFTAESPLVAGSVTPGVKMSVEGSLDVERLFTARQDAHILGKAGIGTDKPDNAAKLSIVGNGEAVKLFTGRDGGHFAIGFYNDGLAGSVRSGRLGYLNDGNKNFTVENEKDNGHILLKSKQNVGINTIDPKSKLSVSGNAAIGTGYSNQATAPSDGLIVQGSVGIGTNSPKNKLDVDGSVAIGGNYSGEHIAPANGLIVQGNVGIGILNPGSPLTVQGVIESKSGGIKFPDGTVQTTAVSSVSSWVAHNGYISPPGGTTTNQWNIFVSLKEINFNEPGPNWDNTALGIECYATEYGNRWQITVRGWRYKGSNLAGEIRNYIFGTANYLLIRKNS